MNERPNTAHIKFFKRSESKLVTKLVKMRPFAATDRLRWRKL
jgi:hypothetical protein